MITFKFKPRPKSGTPLYKQLSEYLIENIRQGKIKDGERLPPVNRANALVPVSRDTVVNAYRHLQEQGWVYSVPGRGFFVTTRGEKGQKAIFLLFDAMNPYKETLYLSMIEELGPNYHCDLSFYYYDRELFDRLITEALGKYDEYVIITHFNTDVTNTLKTLPPERLLLLDGFPRNYEEACSTVYQDFHNQLYEGLMKLHPKLQRYDGLHVMLNSRFQFLPSSILSGMHQYSGETHFPIFLDKNMDPSQLERGKCYMAFTDRELALIIKEVNNRGWKLKEDIGLLSFDDTTLKEVLEGGITTISTDFDKMGRTAADLIRSLEIKRIVNPWYVADRDSL